MTILQTLADFAEVIEFLRIVPDEVPHVILYGSDNGAAYATWLEQLYPDIITGVIAYGAKLTAVLDFGEFYDDITNTVAEIDLECGEIIGGAFEEIGELIDAGQAEEIQRILKLASPPDLNNTQYVASLYSFIAETLAENFIASKYDYLKFIFSLQ